MPAINNVTVQKDIQGGTTILSGANGTVNPIPNGNAISITPAVGGQQWVPLPLFGHDYYISDGNNSHWSAVCTTPPATAVGTGYFTAAG